MNQEQKSLSKSAKHKASTIAKRKRENPKSGEKRKLAFIWGSWRDYRQTPEFLKSFAEELVHWIAEQEEAFSVEAFLISKGLPERTYYEWLDASEDLKCANDFANMIIADRRETGAITRRLDSHSAFRMMAWYSKKYRQVRHFDKSLENQTIATPEIPLIIPDFPSSPLVPERKDIVHDE